MESINGIIKTEALYCRFGKTNIKERRIPIDDIVSNVIRFIAYYNNIRPKVKLWDDVACSFQESESEGNLSDVTGLTNLDKHYTSRYVVTISGSS